MKYLNDLLFLCGLILVHIAIYRVSPTLSLLIAGLLLTGIGLSRSYFSSKVKDDASS